MPNFTGLIYAWICCAGFVLLFLMVVLSVWTWMIFDWNKRCQTDPALADRYRVQMIIGWPFGYYLNVYRKNGPASKSNTPE